MRRNTLLLILLLSSPPAAWAATEAFATQQVKSGPREYFVVAEDGHDWAQTWSITNVSFTPQSPGPVISPLGSDPGVRTANPFIVASCPDFFPGSSQGAANFTANFLSLRDLGVWHVTLNGTWFDPDSCVSSPGAGLCGIACDPLLVGSWSAPFTYHITVTNSAPTATISHSPVPAWNQPVTFTAAMSDPDGGTVTGHWSVVQRPPGSTTNLSSMTGASTVLPFSSDHDIGAWRVQLDADDNEGERRTFAHDVTVPNVPPNISVGGGTNINVLQPIALSVTPTTDVDGGNLDIVWDIVQSPSGSTHAPQSAFVTGPALNIPTTQSDIGTWRFRATATDNEHATDVEDVMVTVNNLPPEIHLSGATEIDPGPAIHVETTPLTDADGGDLTFRWDIVQAPQSAGPHVHEGASTTAQIDIPTNSNSAGTWIFKLTATDNDNSPNSSVSQEYTVLVDGPAVATITAPASVGTLSFPVTLSGADSLDPDSPCPTQTNRCHDTLGGRPVVISPGIVSYTWTLLEPPPELIGTFPTGRVDDVFGVPAYNQDLTFNTGDLRVGEWVFQLKVVDNETNEATTTHTLLVVDESGPPTAVLSPPARYTTDTSGVIDRPVSLDGSFSFDLDNIIGGGVITSGLGISNYQWEVVSAPPGCAPPAPPSGSSATTYGIYAAGAVVDSACHGTWQVRLTVTDDDTPSKTDSRTTSVIIGNCPQNLCIDSPTTLNKSFVDFTDNTDILIYYHLDSALYDDPLFPTGLFTLLEIYHEGDLTHPVFTSLDPNVLPSNRGGFLVFHWNGRSGNNARPEPGLYTVQITLVGGALAPSVFTTSQPQSISIAVSQPEVLPSSDKFVNFDELDAGTDHVNVHYSFTGGATPDEVRWRVLDASSAEVASGTLPPTLPGVVDWNGKPGGVTLPPGSYSMVIESYRMGSRLGASAPHNFVVYRMSLSSAAAPIAGVAPDTRLLLVNGDDDNVDNTADKDQPGPLLGENDLAQFNLSFAPSGIQGTVTLLAASGGPNVKVWDTGLKNTETVLDKVYNLSTDTVPATLFAEGVSPGDAELALVFKDGGGMEVKRLPLRYRVQAVDLDIDTDMNGTLNVADDAVEMNDQAAIVNVNNDDNGGTGNDALNNVIDGATDKAQLTPLILRQNAVLAGGKMILKVSDKTRLRIFDDTDTGVIGPPAADGGPDSDQFEVPAARIGAGDLTFRVECVHPGLVTISLILMQGLDEFSRDEVKVALNVDRVPGATYDTIRNRIFTRQLLPALEGVEARLDGAKPLISWGPTVRNIKSTFYWVSVQDNTNSHWLQTGVGTNMTAAGVVTEYIYFEFVPDYAGYRAGTNPLGYQRFFKMGSTWAAGSFKVEITDRATGTAKAYVDGVEWHTESNNAFKTAIFENYVIGTELTQSVSRNPGSVAAKARVSDARYKDATGWHDTTFAATDISTDITNGRGAVNSVTATTPAIGASNANFHFTWLTGRSFEMWDDRN
jgi:hypothetical protein